MVKDLIMSNCLIRVVTFLFQYQSKVSVLLNHTVPLLKRAGLPSSATMVINSGNHGDGSYYYLQNCSAGNQQVGGEMALLSSLLLKLS